MFCPNCGNNNENGTAKCVFCGTTLIEDNQSSFTGNYNSQQNMNNNAAYSAPYVNNYSPYLEENIPDKYKPVSAWGYVGYMLLFCIPLVNIILMLVFSFGGSTNVNLKNFSRAYLIIMVATIVITILLSVLLGAGMVALMNGM